MGEQAEFTPYRIGILGMRKCMEVHGFDPEDHPQEKDRQNCRPLITPHNSKIDNDLLLTVNKVLILKSGIP